MHKRIRDCLLFPARSRAHAAWSALALVLVALAAWYGLRVLGFHQNLAAAKEALTRYEFPEAQQRLAACLTHRPRDRAVLLLAAQAARRDGQLDVAQEYLDRHQQESIGESSPEAGLQWDLLRVQRGLIKEHVRALIDLLEIRHPQSEQIFESLAQGAVHVYRLDEASFWTKQMLDRYPHNPVGRLLNAQMHETLRHREPALDAARQLVADFPGNDKARLYLAGLLAKARLYDEAAQHYQALRRRQPGDLQALLGLIRVLLPQERLDEAAPLLRQLEHEHADSVDALLLCGRFALRMKRFDHAEQLLRRALRRAPHDHEVHFELAVCLEQLHRPDEARQHLARFKQIEADMMRLEKVFQAMVKAPADPDPRLEAGLICLRNGQDSEGLRWLSGALDLVPDHAATHLALADHYASKGDAERAAHHRGRAFRGGN